MVQKCATVTFTTFERRQVKKKRLQPKGMVSVCTDREIAYICADRVRSVGRLALLGIISGGAIFCVPRLQ